MVVHGKNVIVCDLDDTLWGLNEHILKKHNMFDIYNSITEYNVKKCLSEEVSSMLLEEYRNPRNFEEVNWYDGIEHLSKYIKYLDNNGYVFTIASNSFSEEIADIKHKRIRETLHLPERDIYLPIIGEDEKVISDCLVCIDDCHDIITNADARYKVSVDRPWNSFMEHHSEGEAYWVCDIPSIILALKRIESKEMI